MIEKTHNAPTYNGAELPERFLRIPEVITMTSLPKSTLTDLIRNKKFPAPYKLSERASAFKLSEVMGWIDSRKHAAEGV